MKRTVGDWNKKMGSTGSGITEDDPAFQNLKRQSKDQMS
jgi:hypothetical protein